MSGWIGVDLDGTLAKYDGWQGADHIGEPIAPMVDRVINWLADGREVRIFTARVAEMNGEDYLNHARLIIEEWCEKHLGKKLPITDRKDFGMIELWDDRCVRVIPNKGVPCC